ncbi:MAG: DUF4387 domain-containing protein [Proteobacteria bacterium]|nr:DUF4387 domain-containing protein [Pseudomonadota bacterium]
MKLIDMVTFLFSKNAGPYLVTFDMLFKDKESYDRACRSGVFTKETFAGLYGVPVERIRSVYRYDAARMIKFTMIRDVSCGDFGDASVFGSQQWAPLIDLEVPVAQPSKSP